MPHRPHGQGGQEQTAEGEGTGTERVQTGRARLKKWVETENVQVEVPITREKARLVTEHLRAQAAAQIKRMQPAHGRQEGPQDGRATRQ